MPTHPHGHRIPPHRRPNQVIGFVILRIDPVKFLFPLIQAWPTPSPSAETLLVRREGDDVLFLNELRHRQGTAMKLRLPLRTPGLPAARAVSGKTGAALGRDYRGVAVWSVSRPVAGTSWFIVAKIDRDEIERPVRRSALSMSLIVLLPGPGNGHHADLPYGSARTPASACASSKPRGSSGPWSSISTT